MEYDTEDKLITAWRKTLKGNTLGLYFYIQQARVDTIFQELWVQVPQKNIGIADK